MNEKFEQEAIEAYGYDRKNNLTENGILTVTITLSEYRELVMAMAKADQLKHDMENWELRRQIDGLKQQIIKITTGEEAGD